MTASDLIPLVPFIALAVAALAVMLLAAFRRSATAACAITLAGLGAALLSLPWLPAEDAGERGDAILLVDSFARFYLGLVVFSAAVVALLARDYLARRSRRVVEEFYLLLLLATLGAGLLVASTGFASLFLSLELLSVALYVLVAYFRESGRGLEAALKYLVLASTSSAFLLFGMALVYAETGIMDLDRLSDLSLAGTPREAMFLVGAGMMVVGFGFKLALAPFHMWTPDVYEGAPAPVTAFIATVSKGGVFALLLRFAGESGVVDRPALVAVFSTLAILSMILGNLLALLQENVKRLLAYSSIAHLGYLVVAFVAGGEEGARAAAYYLVVYSITTLTAFGVISLCSAEGKDAERIDIYRGLFWNRPLTAAIFTLALLSLAGIPLTGGFVAKFAVAAAGLRSSLWSLVIVLALTSAVGLFYYLRVIVALYSAPRETSISSSVPRASVGGMVLLSLLVLALLWLGTYPSPLLEMIDGSAVSQGR